MNADDDDFDDDDDHASEDEDVDIYNDLHQSSRCKSHQLSGDWKHLLVILPYSTIRSFQNDSSSSLNR